MLKWEKKIVGWNLKPIIHFFSISHKLPCANDIISYFNPASKKWFFSSRMFCDVQKHVVLTLNQISGVLRWNEIGITACVIRKVFVL